MPVSDRVVLKKSKGFLIDININQVVYAPTTDHADDVVESLYQKLKEARSQAKPHDMTTIMGDLNAKIGRGRGGDIVGNFGLEERNERGDGWV